MTVRLESTAKLPIQIGGLACEAQVVCYSLLTNNPQKAGQLLLIIIELTYR